MTVYEHLKKLIGEKKIDNLKDSFWNLPLSEQRKEKLYYILKESFKSDAIERKGQRNGLLEEYINQVLILQDLTNTFSIQYPREPQIQLEHDDPKLIAFYLPQYYPDPHNTKWWGRGSTEWTNVSKSMPQYLGHYQPRFPGELGFYDLRVMDNIYRQIELAKFYGVYGFCFYFYWFDGERLLDLPLNEFVNDETIDFPFSICWVNESWTRQWSGASEVPLLIQNPSEESYRAFIKACADLFTHSNYIKINGRPILTIYRPMRIPNAGKVIQYWRNYVKERTGLELYLIASLGTPEEANKSQKYIDEGFDACSEFAPGSYLDSLENVTQNKEFVCEVFQGKIYDYKEFVESKRYLRHSNKKIFSAVMPMWDNTPRKKNKGIILDGSTPDLYKQWLIDIIKETKENNIIDDRMIFINAWNEWAEGAYLEPDLKWKYEYLEATADAIRCSR